MEELIRLKETNIEEIASIFADSFECEPWNDDWSDKAQLKAYIRDVSGYFLGLNYGLLVDGKLVAIALGTIRHCWQGTNYYLQEYCVAPDMRGKGIGSRFLSLIEMDLRKQNVAGIFLQTDNGMPAFEFYHKNGFGDLTGQVSLFKKI